MTHREENEDSEKSCALQNPANGQYWVFCGLDCLAQLTEIVMPEAPTRQWVKPIPNTGSCAHCGWCGHLVNRPNPCALHGDDCPTDRWDLTLQGLAATASIVGRFPEPIADAILQALEHVGRRHPEIDGRDLLRWALEH